MILKKITIKRLARFIRRKSNYKISEYDSEFITKELIRLNYCKIKPYNYYRNFKIK